MSTGLTEVLPADVHAWGGAGPDATVEAEVEIDPANVVEKERLVGCVNTLQHSSGY